MALTRVYICDENPRMREIITNRLRGHAEIVGSGDAARGAVAAITKLEPELVVLDYRTILGRLEETVAEIKERRPSTAVVVHTGVPRSLIEDQVTAAGAVYSSKNEPEHLVALVHSVRPAATEAASRGS